MPWHFSCSRGINNASSGLGTVSNIKLGFVKSKTVGNTINLGERFVSNKAKSVEYHSIVDADTLEHSPKAALQQDANSSKVNLRTKGSSER